MAVLECGAESLRGRSKSSHLLAKSVLKSSVVLHAVYGHIRSPATLDVVFGKETSLELLVVSEDGIMQSIFEQPIFGKIKDLKLLPWNEHYRSSQPQIRGKDLLVVTSDSGKMSFLTFCIELHRFLAIAHVQISQSVNARRDLGQFLAVESRGRAIAVGALQDKIAIFPTSIIAGNNIVEKRMVCPKELRDKAEPATLLGTIWSMTFVPGLTDASQTDTDIVVLVVLLHRKGAADNELLVLVSDLRQRSIQLKTLYNPFRSASSFAYLLADVPSLPGFIFVFRCGEIELLEISNSGILLNTSALSLPKIANTRRTEEAIASPGVDEDGTYNEAVSALLELVSRTGESADTSSDDVMEITSSNSINNGDPQGSPLICCWSWDMESSSGLRLIFCVDAGEACLFHLHLSQSGPSEVKMSVSDCLYRCSPLKSLLWTKGGFIAALAEMGDGKILQIKDEKVWNRSTIQNIAPVLDFSLVDYYVEKQDQMFACSGVGNEGSLRIIRNGISVEKLTSTAPLYEGVTGCWTMKICREDTYHAFFVLSFAEETRVLSVGLSFNDITDLVGFNSSACTLACGWIYDGWVTQVCSNEVRVCAPTADAHPKGIQCVHPICNYWMPRSTKIILGAVAHMRVILAMSQPGLLVMLGLIRTSSGGSELIEIQRFLFGVELSCISIPQEEEPFPIPVPAAIVGLVEPGSAITLPNGVEIGKVCVVGTHKPSVELLSIVPGENFSVLAVGQISPQNTMGTSFGGGVPEDVRLVLFDRLYILAGLRNGMLLRFEWPQHESLSGCLNSYTMPDKVIPANECKENIQATELFVPLPSDAHLRMPVLQDSKLALGKKELPFPVQLHLIAVRRVGVSPVSFIPLQASLRADVIALGDRPWLLQTARHSQRIAYTSISFQPSTHATPVKCSECSKGVLFVADCSLHLVEMEHSKRLNVQRFPLGSTPRRILYHVDSKKLLIMRSEYSDLVHGYVSDICCVDPVSGSVQFSYMFDYGEVPKCMELMKSGKEHLLLVGTGLTTGKAMMANGEPDGSKGRLLVFRLEQKRRPKNDLAFSVRSTSALPSDSVLSESSNQNTETYPNYDQDIKMEDNARNSFPFPETDGWELILKSHVPLSGVVLAVAPYLDQYILTCAGNTLSCLGFATDCQYRLKRYDSVRTRFVLMCIAVHLNRIAVGDCRDGILIYSYQEDAHKLEQLYYDPAQRLVADSVLIDLETVLVTDRHANFCALSCPNLPEDSASPERNLVLQCWYHMGEVMMNICKGSLAYKGSSDGNTMVGSNNSVQASEFSESSVIATTLLGSVIVFIHVTREEFELLDALQTRLALYPLTAPLLGNNHANFRGRGCPGGVKKVLDGDMLGQFLELTSSQQQSVLADQPGLESLSSFNLSLQTPSREGFPVEQVLRLLERIYNSLT